MADKSGVCFFFDVFHPIFSGHAVYMQQLMVRFLERGRPMTVLTRNPGHLAAKEVLGEIEIHRIPSTGNALAFSWRVVKKLFELRDRYSCFHVNGFLDRYFLIQLACRLLGKRLVVQTTLFGSDDGYSYLRSHSLGRLRMRILARIDALLAISQPLVSSFVDCGFPAGKLKYIPQGVDRKRFFPVEPARRADIRQSLGLDPGAGVVVFVGTIIHRKGVDQLIESWIEVQRRRPGAQLCLVGEDSFDDSHSHRAALNEYVEGLKKTVAQEGLNVRFCGFHGDIVPWLQAADIFALPSRQEGFGNVILEAMSCGVPPVVTPMDGVALETVVQGHNGYIVDDTRELSQRLIELLENDALARELGRNSLSRVEEHFCLDRIFEKYAELYG